MVIFHFTVFSLGHSLILRSILKKQKKQNQVQRFDDKGGKHIVQRTAQNSVQKKKKNKVREKKKK